MTNTIRGRVFFELIILLAILALAAYIRLINIAHNPGWYTDETVHLNIAANLQQGQWQYLAVKDSILLFGRLPLFEVLLAGIGQIFGLTIVTLRSLCVMLELLTILFLYFLLRIQQTREHVFPLLAALILALYPQAVLYARFGFSYHLLSPLLILMAIGLCDYTRNRDRFWLFLAVASLSLCLITDIFAITLIPVLIVVILYTRPVDVILALPMMLLPVGIYTLLMMQQAPDAFLFDLNFTLNRMNSGDLFQQLNTFRHNYIQLLQFDLWLPAGMIGIFLIRPTQLRVILSLILFVPVVAMGRVVALHQLSFYYMIPLLPLIATGVAGLLRYGTEALYRTMIPRVPILNLEDTQPAIYTRTRWQRFGASIVATGVIAVLIGLPLWHTLIKMNTDIHDGYTTQIDPFLLNATDVNAVADYVNSQTQQSDSVIASTPLAWLLSAHAADFQMSAVHVSGESSPHIPGDLPPERFTFDPDYRFAKFVVVDELWRQWGVHHVSRLNDIVTEMQTWEQVYTAGTLTVYRNPAQP